MTARRPKLAQDAPRFTRHTDSGGMKATCKACGHVVAVPPPTYRNGPAWTLYAKRRVVRLMLRHLEAAHAGET